eukprot:3505961-Rhodomonas_salina.2
MGSATSGEPALDSRTPASSGVLTKTADSLSEQNRVFGPVTNEFTPEVGSDLALISALESGEELLFKHLKRPQRFRRHQRVVNVVLHISCHICTNEKDRNKLHKHCQLVQISFVSEACHNSQPECFSLQVPPSLLNLSISSPPHLSVSFLGTMGNGCRVCTQVPGQHPVLLRLID